MKRIFVLVLALVMCLSGCVVAGEGTVSQEKYDALQKDYNTLKTAYDRLAELYAAAIGGVDANPPLDETEKLPVGGFNAETVLSQLSVTEYLYSSRFAEYAFLTVKNNSNFNLDISVAIKFYNAAGDLVGASNSSESAFEKGTEILFYFMPDEAFAKMEYEFTVSEEDWYDCVVSDLVYETTSAKNKEIVSVTNNGTKAADFVEGSILFFNGDKVVGFDWTYFTDDDSELKPGKTITEEMNCYEEYDAVKLFFTGRR